ncbi:MAG: ISKra4 family transposase, partial [Chloroflexota bacterium]
QAHVHARGTGDVGPAIEMTGKEPAVLERLRTHERAVATVVGTVQVVRMAYVAPKRETVHPLDERATLPERRYSYELQRRVVLGAVQGPFDEACERVAEATGIVVPKRSAELLVRDAASDFDDFYAARTAPPAGQTGPILVAAIDGKGIPMVKPEKALRTVRRGKGEKANKKRMATVAAVFTQQPRPRTPEDVVASLFDPPPPRLADAPPEPGQRASRPEHKRVWASVEKSKTEVIAQAAAEVERRDPDRVKRRVVVTDGERALQKGAAAAIVGCTLVLDLLHALEYLWKAAYCFHKEGSEEAAAWVRERALRLLRGEVSQVVKGIGKSATARRLRGPKRKTVDGVRAYLYRNRHRMRYHEYLRDGLPIASGAVEGACRNLIKDRMERSGMRWTIATAEALVKVRAAYLSGDFEDYWRFHVVAQHRRRHPEGGWRVVEE